MVDRSAADKLIDETAAQSKDNEDKFAELLKLVEPILWGEAGKIARKAKIDAGDVFQELSIALNEMVGIYDGQRPFKTLLRAKICRVAYRLKQKAFGNNVAARSKSIDSVSPESKALAESPKGLSESYANERLYSHLARVLSGRELECTYYRYVEGYKPKEIADLLGIDAKYVSALSTSGRNKLRECLDRETGEIRK